MTTDCGAQGHANDLMSALRQDSGIVLPDLDLNSADFKVPAQNGNAIFNPISRLSNNDLTTGSIGGSGTFDVLMKSTMAHLQKELDANRITGQEYTKAYIALVQGAMSGAVQYLLGRDQAYWAAVNAQQQVKLAEIQGTTARVELEGAKIRLMALKYEALNVEANFALAKMKLATESISYCTAEYQLNTLLPQQNLLAIQQTRGAAEAADRALAERTQLLPKQIEQVQAQTEGQKYQNTQLMPVQKTNLEKQSAMIQEQTEAQRAQTADTRLDGQPVRGAIGKQKELHAQQIISYQRDSEIKAARPFIDAWITMKTIDEGVLPPNGFANSSLDQILTRLKNNNNLS